MNNEYENKSIECTVKNCANHCTDHDYCALKKIVVGSYTKDPSKMTATDCKSFVASQ